MKAFLLSIFLFFTSLLFGESTITIGAGPYIQSQPYKGVKNLLLPSPVIFFDNGIIYARWSRFGIYFLGEKNKELSWGFSLTAQPRTLGYKASDSNYLTGMDERKSTLEGGLAFSASYNKSQYIEIMILHDILNAYKSWIIRTEIGDKYQFGNFTLYPSLVLLYEPKQFLNYYYGVKSYEATSIRPIYSAGNGLQYGLQTYIKYPFSKKLSALINIRYDKLPKSAINSPLTNENFIYSGLFSLIYSFDY